MPQDPYDRLVGALLPRGEPDSYPGFPASTITTTASIVVSHDLASEFLDAYRSLLLGRKLREVLSLYLYSGNKAALPVSYDANWKPFIGQTYGFNPPDSRLYFIYPGALLAAVGSHFRALRRDIAGGRAFITNLGAYCAEGDTKVDLLNWEWPGQTPMYSVLKLLQDRLSPYW